MGMSITLNASLAVGLHEGALGSKFSEELGDRRGSSLLVAVAQGPRAVDSKSRSFGSGSDGLGVAARKWTRKDLNDLLPGVWTRYRLWNGLEIVHGLDRGLALRISGTGVRVKQAKRMSFLVRAAGDQNGSNTTGDDPVETLFMRELRRRGISSDSKGSTGTDTRTKSNDDDDEDLRSSERGWSQQGGPKTKASPQWKTSANDDQLKRSMALNSEGLEGLIPRATELLKLGGSFWIVFWPLILASLATFITLYVYFGSTFLHAGSSIYPGGRPPYVEPYQLLEEESIPSEIGPDRVPYRSNSTP